MKRALLYWLVLCGSCSVSTQVLAQTSLYESEPNNTPSEANHVSGEVILIGTMEGADQDGFQWTVSDVDAQKRWTFELQGIPGRLTIVEVMRVEYADNGVDVASKSRLFIMGTRDGSKPSVHEDLLFEPGEYILGVAHGGGGGTYRPPVDSVSFDSKMAGSESGTTQPGSYRLIIQEGASLALERQPNAQETRDTAVDLREGAEKAAYFESSSTWYRLNIAGTDASHRLDVKGQVPVGRKAVASLLASNGSQLANTVTDAKGKFSFRDLALDIGSYDIEVSSPESGYIRTLLATPVGQRIDGAEAEPNDTWSVANRVELNQPVTGRMGRKNESDYFLFSMDESTTDQLLALQLETAPDMQLQFCLTDHVGRKVQCRKGTNRVELPDLALTTDTWGFVVERGPEAAEYTVSLIEQGAISPGAEVEPNDTVETAAAVSSNNRIKGRFAGDESDFFRITVVEEPQLWRFQAIGDGISRIAYHDGAGLQSQALRVPAGQRRARLENVFLLPGIHHVEVGGKAGGTYTLLARPLGPPHPDSEREPNDDASRAEFLAFGQNRFGILDNKDDNDHYRFTVNNYEHLRLSVEPPVDGRVNVWLRYGSAKTYLKTPRTFGEAPAILQGMFAPGEYYVQLGANVPSDDNYHIKLDRLPRFGCSVDCDPVHTRALNLADGQNPIAFPNELPLKMELVPENASVAAYHPLGQNVSAKLQLHNTGASPISVNLETATSDGRWSVSHSKDPIQITPGQRQTVGLQVRVPADAWDDAPVVVSVRAFDGTGAQAEAVTEIIAVSLASVVNPEIGGPIPPSLRGGINVASSKHGGQLVGASDARGSVTIPGVGQYMDLLIDGAAHEGTGPKIDPGEDVDQIPITVDLSGDQSHDIVGVILDPVGYDSVHYLDEFEIQLSLDGIDFETVLRDRLQQLPHEQAFVLDTPKPARFARLVMLSSHDNNLKRGAGLGEWKVVAKAGNDATSGEGWNLADPDLGGHIVWADPVMSPYWDRYVLSTKQEHPGIRSGQALQWVVGFHNERAARVARFEWVESPRATQNDRINKVIVSVSTDSPVGPWIKVADWDRHASPDSLSLETAVWARYVRFSVAPPDKTIYRYVPDTLRVFEQPSNETYDSILGEWGATEWRSQYDLMRGIAFDPNAHSVSGNNSRSTAATLALDQRINGTVLLGKEEDWYQLTVPAGQNSLEIGLFGLPTVKATVSMFDGADSEILLRQSRSKTNETSYVAAVESGRTYYLKVEEPQRAVIFAFDNSQSVNPYANSIYRALSAYSEDLQPERDVANILPFGGSFLARNWIGEPYLLRKVLNDYHRSDSSSDAETSLDRSAIALGSRPGTKAVVMVTDAATPRYSAMWTSMHRVQPRVFTMRVGESEYEQGEDLMQSWARVNDGHYAFVSSQAEMDRAFSRAATMLRRPAFYALEATTSLEEASGPGYLEVVSGDARSDSNLSIALPQPAIEVILDASGSMLKRMGGKRRYQVARDVLKDLVDNKLPDNIEFGLRVFGHTEAGSCRTDLEIPIAVLDRAGANATINAVTPKNLAKTPIAASLTAAAADLNSARGEVILLLITDGEETCGGNPEQAITELKESGVDAVVNIIGFAINDDELDATFRRWAKAGGGTYRHAMDAESLAASIEQLTKRQFSVINSAGEVLGPYYSDGDPIELPMGGYRVSFGNRVEEIRIFSESITTLRFHLSN